MIKVNENWSYFLKKKCWKYKKISQGFFYSNQFGVPQLFYKIVFQSNFAHSFQVCIIQQSFSIVWKWIVLKELIQINKKMTYQSIIWIDQSK